MTAEVDLEAGKELPLRVEYSHRTGVGKAELDWALPTNEEAVRVAKDADVVVAVLGLNWDFAMEGHDLPTLEVPEDQESFIKSIVAANPRTAVVLINGNPLAIRWIKATCAGNFGSVVSRVRREETPLPMFCSAITTRPDDCP